MGFMLAMMGPMLSAAGSLESGQAEANAATYNAQVARLNAAYTSSAGMSAAETASLASAGTLGKIVAAQGANNIDVNTGSALKVQQTARGFGKLSAENVENNALLKAYGYEEESQLDTEEARQDIIGSYFGAAADIAGSGSQFPGFGDQSGPSNFVETGNTTGPGGYSMPTFGYEG